MDPKVKKKQIRLTLKRNPEALTKLWGSAHPRPESLTAYYDSEEGEWLDRRGRPIRDKEITKKAPQIEHRGGGRVEVWESEEEEETDPNKISIGSARKGEYTTATSLQDSEFEAVDSDIRMEVDEEEIARQLVVEKNLGLSLLETMFKDDQVKEHAAMERKERNRARDAFKIVHRFDPNAPESESEREDASSEEKSGSENDDQEQEILSTRDVGERSTTDHDVQSSYPTASERVSTSISQQETQINTFDLTSIFTPANGTATTFSLFGGLVDDDLDESEVEGKEDDTTIHPDRLNRSLDAEVYDNQDELDANHVTLSNSRGFTSQNVHVREKGPFPLLLQDIDHVNSIWHREMPFFGNTLDPASIKSRWEATKHDTTRDWKRKRKEGLKRIRKQQIKR